MRDLVSLLDKDVRFFWLLSDSIEWRWEKFPPNTSPGKYLIRQLSRVFLSYLFTSPEQPIDNSSLNSLIKNSTYILHDILKYLQLSNLQKNPNIVTCLYSPGSFKKYYESFT